MLLSFSFIYKAIKSPQEEPLDGQNDDAADSTEDKRAKNMATYIVLTISLVYTIVYYFYVIKRMEKYQDYDKSKWSVDLKSQNSNSKETMEQEKDKKVE